jgi:hypothetical protein
MSRPARTLPVCPHNRTLSTLYGDGEDGENGPQSLFCRAGNERGRVC